MTKVCFKCKEEKLLLKFYQHPGMKDGHLNKCKECSKRDVREHRRNNDSVREYDRNRYKNSLDRRRKSNESARKRRKEQPNKYKARTFLGHAVRDGRIIKPSKCSRCGETGRRIEGHHEDYDKPLDVIWLCTLCHRRYRHLKSNV